VVFAAFTGVGAYATAKLWRADADALARRVSRPGLGRLKRGMMVTPLSAVICSALWLWLIILVGVAEASNNARIAAGISVAALVASFGLWGTASWWGRPSWLLLPAVRNAGAWKRVVRPDK
jgi:hypothetical protein